MADSIKIETDTLKALAVEYRNHADSFDKVCNDIINYMKEYNEIWQGKFSRDFYNDIDKITKEKTVINNNCTQLAAFLDNAVKLYIDVDRGVIPKENVNANDYPPGVKPSKHIPTNEELQELYNKCDNLPRNPSVNGKPGSVSCAALAKKKAELHGFIPQWNGNGNQVYYNIHSTNDYTADKYPGGNCLKDILQKEGDPVTDIVISFPKSGSYGNKYGHVIYIDKIENGQVYFSDNRNPGSAKVRSIDSFLKGYYSSCGEPIGCVHLKKN